MRIFWPLLRLGRSSLSSLNLLSLHQSCKLLLQLQIILPRKLMFQLSALVTNPNCNSINCQPSSLSFATLLKCQCQSVPPKFARATANAPQACDGSTASPIYDNSATTTACRIRKLISQCLPCGKQTLNISNISNNSSIVNKLRKFSELTFNWSFRQISPNPPWVLKSKDIKWIFAINSFNSTLNNRAPHAWIYWKQALC